MDESVYGLFLDAQQYYCLRVEVTDTTTSFLMRGPDADQRDKNKKSKKSAGTSSSVIDLHQLSNEDFNRFYKPRSTGHPLSDIAQRMLNLRSSSVHVTPRALAHLAIIAKLPQEEPPMATKKTTEIKPEVDPKTGVPSQKGTVAETAVVVAGPKGTTPEMVAEAAKVVAAKKAAEPKKAEPKKAEPKKAEPKKADAPTKNIEEPVARGRRGQFSDTNDMLKLTKRPTEGKKRALMISELLETGENRSLKISILLKKMQKRLEDLGQRDPVETVLNVHGGWLVSEGYAKVVSV